MKRWILMVMILVVSPACGEVGGVRTTAITATTLSTTSSSTAPTTTRVTTSSRATTTTTAPATTTTTKPTTTTTRPPTTTTTSRPTTTTAPATTTTSAPSPGKTVTVATDSFSFSPSTISINVGDTVQWNLSGGTHTTTSGVAPTPDGRWNQVIGVDAPVSVTFDQVGDFPFFCRFHPDQMTGVVVVKP